MTSVGFIGLGSMGSAMAGRLLETGHDVTVWNRTPERAQALAGAGATVAATAAEAMRRDVTFAMVADDAAADAVLDAGTLAAGAGTVFVHTSSISPAEADILTERAQRAGVAYVAAPVLGRPPIAAAGKLNILAAGPEDAIATALPVLRDLSVRVWRFGERPRVANVVKVAVNYNIIHAIQAMGETVGMTERHGVDPEEFIELLSSTLFGGVVYSTYGAMIAKGEYHPAGFAIALGAKDHRLAEEVAAEVGLTLPTAPAIRAGFEAALAHPELKDYDWGALAESTRRALLDRTDEEGDGHD